MLSAVCLCPHSAVSSISDNRQATSVASCSDLLQQYCQLARCHWTNSTAIAIKRNFQMTAATILDFLWCAKFGADKRTGYEYAGVQNLAFPTASVFLVMDYYLVLVFISLWLFSFRFSFSYENPTFSFLFLFSFYFLVLVLVFSTILKFNSSQKHVRLISNCTFWVECANLKRCCLCK